MTLDLTPEQQIQRQHLQQKMWREAHPDKVKAYYTYHRTRPEHRERIRLWHASHREQINSRARERLRLRRLAEIDHPLSVGSGTSEDTDQVQSNSSAE